MLHVNRNGNSLIIEGLPHRPYTLYMDTDATFSQAHICMEGNQSTATIANPYPHQRTYFKVVFDNSVAYAAERLVPLKSVCNYRDVGGYLGADNRQVCYNVFYRCAALHTLSAEDLALIESTGVKTVMDLRSQSERMGKEDIPIAHVTQYNISGMAVLDQHKNDRFDFGAMLQDPKALEHIAIIGDIINSGYQQMPFNNTAYKQMFACLQAQKVPLIIHCTAGKDRTGIGTALFLLALGVSQEQVIADYMLSNKYRKEENDKMLGHISRMNPALAKEASRFLYVQEPYITNSLKNIIEKYVTFEAYFEAEFQLDAIERKRLQEMYLYKNAV